MGCEDVVEPLGEYPEFPPEMYYPTGYVGFDRGMFAISAWRHAWGANDPQSPRKQPFPHLAAEERKVREILKC